MVCISERVVGCYRGGNILRVYAGFADANHYHAPISDRSGDPPGPGTEAGATTIFLASRGGNSRTHRRKSSSKISVRLPRLTARSAPDLIAS